MGDERLRGAWSWRRALLDSDEPSTRKHVLLTLSCYVSEAGFSAFPSLAELARATGLHRDTVKRHLRDAEGRWIHRDVRQTETGRQTSNLYHLTAPGGGGAENPPSHPVRGGRGGRESPPEGGQRTPPYNSKEEQHKREGESNGDLFNQDGVPHEVQLVWEHYVQRYAERYSEDRAARLKLDACGRRGKIKARLREGYGVEELLQAIDGCYGDEWHAERGKDELEYILRNQSKVEDFLDRYERNGGGDDGEDGVGWQSGGGPDLQSMDPSSWGEEEDG